MEKPITCVAPGGVFTRAFADYDFDSPRAKTNGIYYQCLCVSNIPPRDEMWELEREMGSGFLDDLMNCNKITNFDGEITFFFPERWLSVQEQSAFTLAIEAYQKKYKPVLKMIQIATSSPMIVGNFAREQVRVLKYEKLSQLSRVVKQCPGYAY